MLDSIECLSFPSRFCENGSLHIISKRFGKFPESLVAVYISQVLEGLVYLHDQGVIHRDIKGANILTNKDGTVKLADFGVAAKTGGVTDGAVVGSPYWSESLLEINCLWKDIQTFSQWLQKLLNNPELQLPQIYGRFALSG